MHSFQARESTLPAFFLAQVPLLCGGGGGGGGGGWGDFSQILTDADIV